LRIENRTPLETLPAEDIFFRFFLSLYETPINGNEYDSVIILSREHPETPFQFVIINLDYSSSLTSYASWKCLPILKEMKSKILQGCLRT